MEESTGCLATILGKDIGIDYAIRMAEEEELKGDSAIEYMKGLISYI